MKTVLSRRPLKPVSPLRCIALMATLVAILISTYADAAVFGVRVVDERGAPVSGVSVCFGLPGNYSQFGTAFTNQVGEASSSVPNVPFVITISKTRFSGLRIKQPARGFNLIQQITLSEGHPGPRCKAGSTLADVQPSRIAIERLSVDTQGRVPAVTVVATGEPNQYRLGLNENLDNERWQTLPPDVVRVPARFASQERIFMQLRRYQERGRASLEQRSSVMSVYLQPADMSL